PTIQPDRIPVPNSAYLHLSEQSSVRLTDPTERRKLLILDLNGTLLYREPRFREGRDPYVTNEPRQLRPTHPRPYIPSFKAFLFHPATRKWLDTMVWSSAQYANVKDMVGRCFGEEQKEGLVAIWDRKFLGLNELQYRNKFQTTKNLAKPWALLPLSTLSGPTKLLTHSAFSTLLLDDSPLKARMQPYNHICVPEYEGNFYARDVNIAEEHNRDAISKKHNFPIRNTVALTEALTFKKVTRAGTGKRKRSRSPSPTASPRFRKKQKELDAKNLSQHHDHILLAVIGLLDALQHESNVAAWIKRKGLFATHIFSDPHASPPGLTGRELDIEESDVPVENASVEPNGIESPIAPTSNSEVPLHPLPSLWYQHPPTRQYWVRRGVRALRELGLQVIPGV
ncbi:hypothetical protein GGU11DRAFT_662020, partial [Lentinula aff. detonsa]